MLQATRSVWRTTTDLTNAGLRAMPELRFPVLARRPLSGLGASRAGSQILWCAHRMAVAWRNEFQRTTFASMVRTESGVRSAISNDGSMEIYVSNLNGSNVRRLTRTNQAINISPDGIKGGREIAFISSREARRRCM